MTLRMCYERFGGDYDDVVARLTDAALVRRLTLQFLRDSSYDDLCSALERGEGEQAFQAAHTLKGVALDLGFTRLYRSALALERALRGGGVPREAEALLAQVTQDHTQVTDALWAMRAEEQGY